MKKHLYRIFLLPVVLLAATACNDNDYETTMGNVDQRLDEAISSYYGELSAAETAGSPTFPHRRASTGSGWISPTTTA